MKKETFTLLDLNSKIEDKYLKYEPSTEFQKGQKVTAEFLIDELRGVSKNIEQLSDGYHSFEELYEFRKVYNAALFNEWHIQNKYDVHKSMKHFDGEFCFGGGWFIVVANLPSGQISNHYRLEDWDLFKIPEFITAKYEFDGHTPQDVLERLKSL